jgi:predicted Zn-ribbon and HTH transcriptional regulator
MIQLLEEREWSARDLAEHLQLPVRDIEEHLAHVVKTIARNVGQRFLMQPSNCQDCGFVFHARSRLTPPSRCPQCRGEFILPPRFHITTTDKAHHPLRTTHLQE